MCKAFEDAQNELELARAYFDNAEPDFFEAANARYTAAIKQLDAVVNSERKDFIES